VAKLHHPHAEWTRERLESYIGTTETLTLEFKSYQALLPGDGKDKDRRLQEAARDVAGMANEQGGNIVYGIEEDTSRGFRRAKSVEEGFLPEHGVSREWFLQFIRDRVQPPLGDIDAVDVPLDYDRRALVVLVPQARGSARQTDDHIFWRRDAQRLRAMSVQEIEDVRSRNVRPRLTLDFLPAEAGLTDERRRFQAQIKFGISNGSEATADFAVLTVGFASNTSVGRLGAGWRYLSVKPWRIARTVIASGSCDFWSPITPGFTLVVPGFVVSTPVLEQDWLHTWRAIGLVRLDHSGGASIYQLRFSVSPTPGLGLEQDAAGSSRQLWSPVPELFFLGL
jgi:hypothetical protein